MTTKSESVQKHRSFTFKEWCSQSIAHDDSAEWGITTRDTLGKSDHVGLILKSLASEPIAETTKTTNHFIRDQQDSVLVTDLANALPVPGWRN